MGKQGPCCHCGVTSTPLWRNGPPEKPVLCNACGSRWRTKGTLANYTPLHARADAEDYVDHRVSRMKSVSVNKNKEPKTLKRKFNQYDGMVGRPGSDFNQGFRKVVDEDASNRSSSGSAISNSESCAQFGGPEGSDLTGPAQSNVWDTTVPSKKRTCVGRPKPSPVEKLTKDLYTILQEQQSSCFSASSEEELLFESETPMVSVEIGHGSILMRHPNSVARDEESEASSLSVENKHSANEAYSRSMKLLINNETKSVKFSCLGTENSKNVSTQGIQREQVMRDKSQYEKLQILGSHSSPLCAMDLTNILNFKEFVGSLTKEEQQQLMKFLPPIDTAKFPDGLIGMFDSPQFKENLSSFQQLLADGVFDNSLSGAKPEDCKAIRKTILSNLTKSHWVESYCHLKKHKNASGGSSVRGQNPTSSSNLISVNRSYDSQNLKFSESKTTMKSPKRVVMKPSYENKENMENEASCFSPRSLFAFPPDNSSVMLGSVHYVDGNYDQDILLDVPSNGSFPQAELLYPTTSFSQQASTN